jgi:hypothetical protein
VTSLADIEHTLPWGLHDAYLESLEIDWPTQTATLTVRLMMTERQDMDRLGRITVTGLAFCSIDPPHPYPRSEAETDTSVGLWIDAGEGPANDEAKARLPEVPEGCFVHWIFAHQWNSCMHISGRDAELVWLEPEPVASKRGQRAFFPGDWIPDPVGPKDK